MAPNLATGPTSGHVGKPVPRARCPPCSDGAGRLMDPFHERLARIGLEAAHQYGFALAGGYAVQAAGMLQRPTEDIDLFTAWERRDDFTAAVTAVVDAYKAAG